MVPTLLRGAVLIDYLRALLEPIRIINYKAFVDIGYNSSIYSQELYLNTLYGIPYNPNTREADIADGLIIWIENWANVTPALRWYTDADAATNPIWFVDSDADTNPIWFADIDYQSVWEFRVNVPIATAFDTTVLKSQTNKYLPEGRRYVIQTY